MKNVTKHLKTVAITLLVVWVGYALVFHGEPGGSCEEDQLLQGYGQFNNGGWSEYRCINP